jgi:hypothetical protein
LGWAGGGKLDGENYGFDVRVSKLFGNSTTSLPSKLIIQDVTRPLLLFPPPVRISMLRPGPLILVCVKEEVTDEDVML